jgi:uracil-DNA glycosylase family 4
MTETADPRDDRQALEGLLRWYVAMGVDAAIDEEPHDRFMALPVVRPDPATPEPAEAGDDRARAPRVAPRQPESAPPPRQRLDAPSVPADILIRQAEALAAEAADIADLVARWAELPGCGLAATASQMIVADGTPGAKLMLVGAAPESDDERHGAAFSGARGQLLDAMLRAIGLDRASAYLINVIPWRPPGNRPPTPLELALCLPFTRRHIALAKPEMILCLGERAAQPVLGSSEPISRLRGRWMAHEGETRTVKTLVTFSPDYLMKQPLQKRRAWMDLQMLANETRVPRST